MKKFQTSQDWRQNAAPNQKQKSSHSIKPSKDSQISKPLHGSQAPESTRKTRRQNRTRPSKQSNRTNSVTNLLEWDDFNRDNSEAASEFYCYKCAGGLLLRSKICSGCGTDNMRIFEWQEDIRTGIEELGNFAAAIETPQDAITRKRIEGSKEFAASREPIEDVELWRSEGGSQMLSSMIGLCVSGESRTRVVLNEDNNIPVVKLPNVGSHGWDGKNSTRYFGSREEDNPISSKPSSENPKMGSCRLLQRRNLKGRS